MLCDAESIELGLQVLQSYERWGTWLVTLSVTALGAISVRHGLTKNGTVSDLAFQELVLVGGLLFLSSAFAAYLVGNLKYVGVRLVDGTLKSVTEIPSAILNERFLGLSIGEASAIAGILFWLGACAFIVFEYRILKKAKSDGKHSAS